MSIYNTLLGQQLNHTPAPAPGPDYSEHFYVEDISGSDNTLSIRKTYSSSPTLTIEISSDRVNWSTMGTTSTTTAITTTIPANSKLYLRCSANTWGEHGYSDSDRINCSGNYNVGGNIMSLLYGSNFTGEETSLPSLSTSHDRTFECLFYQSATLRSAENLLLPATALNDMSYMNMFYQCTALTKGPVELPATTLKSKCYSYMFYQCSSLTTAPSILPATTLAANCYESMYKKCSQIRESPLLPATILVSSCYTEMFRECSNLEKITCLATDISATSCTSMWTLDIPASGTFYKNPNMSTWPTSSNGTPSGWAVEDYQG